jgi:hypothetical protein
MLEFTLLFQLVTAVPSLEEILSRVALNQARSQQLRSAYVYDQRLFLRFHRGDGRVARDETREYTVTPLARGVRKTLVQCQCPQPEDTGKGLDLDGILSNVFAEDFTNDPDSRDGIGHNLFPLSAHQQLKCVFTLKRTEDYQGRTVFRLAFRPRDKRGEWAGEALIDATEYQPVFVRTRMAHGVPLAVKTLLGSNLRGYGFAVTYARFDDVWLPVSYGGEFSLRVLFGYKRNISVNLLNRGFHRVQAKSTIVYGETVSTRPHDAQLPPP